MMRAPGTMLTTVPIDVTTRAGWLRGIIQPGGWAPGAAALRQDVVHPSPVDLGEAAPALHEPVLDGALVPDRGRECT